jgi:GDP-L-fucose synthase
VDTEAGLHGTVRALRGGDAVTFFSNKRVVVTGGAGFLGSFVVDKLRERGCRQIVVPRSRDYDLVDGEAVRRMYRDTRPELVIHLAAKVGGIGANQKNPGKFFYDNLMMGVQLIHEGWKAGVGKLVAAATICAYPKFTPVPFREEDLWNGYPEETNAPYGLAKKMLLVQSAAYREQYGFNSVVVFPVNLYGPGDNFDLETSHVIPAMVRKFDEAMKSGRGEVTLWGDGSPSREFLYVEDAAEGILDACERYDSSEPVNLGSGREIRIRELAEVIGSLMGFKGRLVYDTTKPNGQPRRALDTRRARERFGWAARTSFEEGLRRTIAWWRTQT